MWKNIKSFFSNIITKFELRNRYNTDWAKKLALYELNYRTVERNLYYELIDMIRNVDDGAFDVASAANCRYSQGLAICQKKEFPWDYLYTCMKLSMKDFCIILPPEISNLLYSYVIKERKVTYAWYDTETNGIKVFAYTGNYEEEENTYPAYDGFGRYDTYYEIVEGILSKECKWIMEPKCRFISLYSM